MTPKWHVRDRRGKELGSFTLIELKIRAEEGLLANDVEVLVPDEQRWVTLKEAVKQIRQRSPRDDRL